MTVNENPDAAGIGWVSTATTTPDFWQATPEQHARAIEFEEEYARRMVARVRHPPLRVRLAELIGGPGLHELCD